jgi:hypothetical protein
MNGRSLVSTRTQLSAEGKYCDVIIADKRSGLSGEEGKRT